MQRTISDRTDQLKTQTSERLKMLLGLQGWIIPLILCLFTYVYLYPCLVYNIILQYNYNNNTIIILFIIILIIFKDNYLNIF